MSRSRAFLLVLLFAALVVPAAPAQAASSLLCSGYDACARAGYSHHGYATNQKYSYWRMYTGINCTNYVAYRLVTTNGMPNTRPHAGVGNARDWGTAMASVTNQTPTVGSVAWWGRTGNHVAYVERVVSATEIIVSESNWGRPFDWRRITKSGSGWPDGFIHFKDPGIRNTSLPTIKGTARVGDTLTATRGSWSPAATSYRYAWLADGAVVSGATGSTFTPAAAHKNKRISVRVSALRSGAATVNAVSAATAAVVPGTVTFTTMPRVTGPEEVGSTLRVAPGSWAPASATAVYRWLADGQAIPGAVQPEYVVEPGDVGRRISVTMTVDDAGYWPVKATLPTTADVRLGTLRSDSPPTIPAAPRAGEEVVGTPGTWAPAATETYQWFADGVPVEGATSLAFTPPVSLVGDRLQLVVTARRDGYADATVRSTVSEPVRPATFAVDGPPAITGSPLLGQVLTVDPGAVTPTGTLRVQWRRDGKPITGATALTYRTKTYDLGRRLSVHVRNEAEGYTPLERTASLPDTVRSVSNLAHSWRIGRDRATFSLRVTVPHVARPTGWVSVTIGGTRKSARIGTDGRATITLTGVKKGRHKTRIAYSGDTRSTRVELWRQVTVS